MGIRMGVWGRGAVVILVVTVGFVVHHPNHKRKLTTKAQHGRFTLFGNKRENA
jgi:hypothetical protein